MSVQRLTRKTGHLLRTTDTGHLALSCVPPKDNCTVACPVTPGVFGEGGCPPNQQLANAVNVTINAAKVCECDYDTAPPYHVFQLDPSGVVGHSFHLTWVGTHWEGTFDVTGLIKFLRCFGPGSPNSCDACTPDEDVTDEARLTISVFVGGSVSFSLGIMSSDPDVSPPGDFGLYTMGADTTTANTWTSCCNPWALSGDAPCSPTAVETIIVTSLSVTLC